jgi:hypothetical protein
MEHRIPMTFQRAPRRLIQILQTQIELEGTAVPPDPVIPVRSIHVSNDLPRYKAVSYLWGSDKKTKLITINGEVCDITENLYVLLRRLQSYLNEISDPDCYFWIDALCINQNDDKEKSSEVSKMDEIYSEAAEVICWLGPADEANNSDSVMDDFDNLGRKAIERGYLDIPNHESWFADWCYVKDWQADDLSNSWEHQLISETKLGVQDTDHLNPVNIRSFMRRPYFNRVWIYQEVTLGYSQTFLCGDKVILGDRLEAAMMFYIYVVFARLSQFSNDQVKAQDVINMGVEYTDMDYLIAAPMLLRCCWRSKRKRELFEIISEFLRCDSGVSDPRDRVFGIWGMVDRSQDYGISPDYALSTAEVYSKTAKYLIRRHGTSILMLCHGLESNRTPGLPSWVSIRTITTRICPKPFIV